MTDKRGRGRPGQIPLDLGHTVARSRDDLVASAANREAVDLVDRWPDWPAPVVALVGPAGSGKSHLAAVWRERAGAVALPREGLSDAAEGTAMRPVLIDDADGAGLDETGLFHLLNAARAAGTPVLLAARTPPARWPVGLPDLLSRLRTAAVVTIREPDDALLAGVLAKLFADRQVEVDPAVVQFLLRRIERSLVTAAGVVDRLDRAALEAKAPITRALAGQMLDAADEGQREFDL